MGLFRPFVPSDNMTLPLFLRVFLLSCAASLMAYVLFPMPLLDLSKLLALSLALTMLVPLAYPHIRGVRRGDSVDVVNEPQRAMLPLQIPFLHFGGTHLSLDDGRIGSRIRISMPDGTWREAVIVSYSGFLSPARVQLLQTAEFSMSIL
ncbi:MAG: hypothetical protein Q7T16_06185 [Candidatus Burarchaeum sp.]|nr:hypothetical protein [Candidatus Burarchaeum sp.]MDO8340217.1 hypothetical protein [Candidatus Burarchaeum sp.]